MDSKQNGTQDDDFPTFIKVKWLSFITFDVSLCVPASQQDKIMMTFKFEKLDKNKVMRIQYIPNRAVVSMIHISTRV